MPSRGSRSGGGGSRPSRSSTPRSSSRSSSSGGSRGFRIGSSSQTPRSSVFNTPSNDTSDSDQIYRQPNMYPRNYGSPGMGLNWRTIAIIVGLILLGICACAAVGLFLQGMGYFS